MQLKIRSFCAIYPISLLLILNLPFQASSWSILPLQNNRRWFNDIFNLFGWNKRLKDFESLTDCLSTHVKWSANTYLDGLAVYNHLGSPTAYGIAIYSNRHCGREVGNRKTPYRTHLPQLAFLLDADRLNGIHLADLKDMGVNVTGTFFRAIDPVIESRPDGVLYDSNLKPGIYLWGVDPDSPRTRHFMGNDRARYVDGAIAQLMTSTRELYRYVRLLLENLINPDRLPEWKEKQRELKWLRESEVSRYPTAAAEAFGHPQKILSPEDIDRWVFEDESEVEGSQHLRVFDSSEQTPEVDPQHAPQTDVASFHSEEFEDEFETGFRRDDGQSDRFQEPVETDTQDFNPIEEWQYYQSEGPESGMDGNPDEQGIVRINLEILRGLHELFPDGGFLYSNPSQALEPGLNRDISRGANTNAHADTLKDYNIWDDDNEYGFEVLRKYRKTQ